MTKNKAKTAKKTEIQGHDCFETSWPYRDREKKNTYDHTTKPHIPRNAPSVIQAAVNAGEVARGDKESLMIIMADIEAIEEKKNTSYVRLAKKYISALLQEIE